MKVTNTTGAYQVFQTYGAKKAKALEASKTVETSKIGIELSSTAKLFSFALEEAKKAEGFREDKVGQIKKEIENGKYNLELEKVAKAILV